MNSDEKAKQALEKYGRIRKQALEEYERIKKLGGGV